MINTLIEDPVMAFAKGIQIKGIINDQFRKHRDSD